MVHVVARGGVDRDHLQRDHRVDSFLHRAAQDVVEVPVFHERVGMGVVRYQIEKARVDVSLGDSGGKLGQIAPGRSLAQLGVLAEPRLGERVFGAR